MKRYVTMDQDLINQDQCEGLDERFRDLIEEYDEKETLAAQLVKDADVLELLLTLKELSFKGNKEADLWLTGKGVKDSDEYRQLRYLKTEVAKALAKEIYHTGPTEW